MSLTFKIDGGDIQSSSATGKFITISGKRKLNQEVAEFFTIETLPNGFGAGLNQLLGVVQSQSTVAFTAIAERQISSGIRRYLAIRQAEPRINITSEEKIVDVTFVQVQQDPSDLTRFYYDVRFLTDNGLQYNFASLFTAGV